MMLPLMVIIGGAVDYARAVAVSTEQQSAIDAAVLAGSVAAGPDTNRVSVATSVFTANYHPERYGASMPTPTATSVNGVITVSATTRVPMTFLKFAYINAMSVVARSSSPAAGPPGHACMLALNPSRERCHPRPRHQQPRRPELLGVGKLIEPICHHRQRQRGRHGARLLHGRRGQ